MLSLLLVSQIMPIPPLPRQEWDCEAPKKCHHVHVTYGDTFQGTWNTARSIIHTVRPLQWDQMVDPGWSTTIFFLIFTDLCPWLQFSRCPVASNYLIALASRHYKMEVLPINHKEFDLYIYISLKKGHCDPILVCSSICPRGIQNVEPIGNLGINGQKIGDFKKPS